MSKELPDHVTEQRELYFVFPEDNQLLAQEIYSNISFLEDVLGSKWVNNEIDSWSKTFMNNGEYWHKADIALSMNKRMPIYMIAAYKKILNDFKTELAHPQLTKERKEIWVI